MSSKRSTLVWMSSHDPPLSVEICPLMKKRHTSILKTKLRCVRLDVLRNIGPRLAIIMHRLSIQPKKSPMKEALRHMHPDIAAKVEVEVDKSEKADFIWFCQHAISHVADQRGPNQKEEWENLGLHRL